MKKVLFMIVAMTLLACNQTKKSKQEKTKATNEPVIVTPETFIRAETDRAFMEMIKNAGQTNKFFHFRQPTPLDKQTVIRMNRDVLYSGGVFDASDGLDITFPEMPDDRYASIFIIDNDHYVQDLIYQPGQYKIEGNTDFLYIIIRLQVFDAGDNEEIALLNDLQDKFIVKSISSQEFPEFKWNLESLDSLRAVYNEESAKYSSWEGMMGKRGAVNEKTRHIAAAAAWGLLPEEAATYLNYKPKEISASDCYTATYKVPVNKGFWSITVYGDDGYIKTENCLLNNSNVQLNGDGTFTVHYGSKDVCGEVPNRLDAPEGWNFLLRVYLPGEEVLSGDYLVPEVEKSN
ncbi:Protein of unknown function [Zhouia amylolytica]|uniref:DUF1214 domain-containing protein n=1 Tax=Zhouia amylolytica TaxID=376730 RepID=A0A1I6T3Q6_9FLAO|nr:DUF1214 domain-containing protein [Zhouia amylolytica]SFS83690.1 Protein of unknown function [Zhouia amylolytica]